MFTQWATAIVNSGTTGHDEETVRRIQAINFVSALGTIILLSYNSFYVLWGDASLVPLIRIIFVCTLLFLLPFLLIQKQKISLAGASAMTGGITAVMAGTAYLGTDTGIHFFAFLMATVSVLITGRSQILLTVVYVSACAGVMALCAIKFDPGLISPFPPVVVTIILYTSVFSSISSMAAAIAHYRYIFFKAEMRAHEAHEQTRKILNSILPHAIARQLEINPEQIIAEKFDSLTVLFADIVSFTSRSKGLNPEEVVGRLDQVFSTFDQLAKKHGLEKIKTIGDCYMLVGGAPEKTSGHVDRVVQMALEMQVASAEFANTVWPDFQIRIGIHTGPAVAGVIGQSKFAYDVWGDTVNVAARLEEACAPEEILISGETRNLLTENSGIEEKLELDLKGRGTYEAWKVPVAPAS